MDSSPLVVFMGLRDWMNPCFLASLGILAAVVFFLRRKRIDAMLFAAGFLVAYLVGATILDLGLFNSFFLPSLESHLIMIVFYLTIAAAFIVLGGYLFYAWMRILKGQGVVLTLDLPRSFSYICWVLGLFLGGVMVFFAAFWPPSLEVTLIQAQVPLPGKLLISTVLLISYEIFRVLLPGILFWGYFWMKKDLRSIDILKSKRSFLCMLASVFYLGMGISLIIIFYPVRPV